YMGTIKSYVAKTEYTLKVLSIIPLRMERVTGQVKISWIEDNGKPVGEWNIKKLPAITSEALPEKITGNIFLALVMVLLFITTLTNRANLGTKLSRLLIFYVLNILVLLIFISVVKQSAVAEMLSPQGFVVVSMATLAVGLMASLLLVREKKVDNSWAMFTEIFIVGVVVIFSIPGTICSPGNYAAIFALLASSCAVGFILAIPIRRYKLRRLKAVMPFGFQKEL
ncbi:MAG: hypothetical protein NTZ97_04485, partial [Candidatus Moranbacteria bacterium]|nr:hypothetical protein [Candidatus Moranbacteria bacterium]